MERSDEGLAAARRKRLLREMQAAGIDEIVAYGNAWQGDYLRYVSDFGILEGHGIAVMSADGTVELFLDSATDAERAEAEALGVAVMFGGDVVRAVGQRLDRVANHRLAAAPRKFLPRWLADADRSFKIEDATALLDRLLMHKLPAEIEAIREAARLADDAYVEFRKAVRPGRAQYRDRRRSRRLFAPARLTRQFHDHRLGRQGCVRHDAAIGASDRAGRPRHD